MSDMRGMLKPGNRVQYCLAGDATFTIMNPATGTRFTFRVSEADIDPDERCRCGKTRKECAHRIRFVRVLTGPDNTGDYEYLGTIFENGEFRVTRKSRISADAPSARAFAWLADKNWEDPRIEVWHEGSCGRCGRKLTVPESVELGIGPVCAGR